ncbi:MAG: hypothetical protein Q7R76_04890 [Candidatus Woesearchaeota archaeon]|nr:hypothetical protein [Candidatus Woesearchaeota archaeon]
MKEKTMARILLLGVDHADSLGASRLEAALRAEKPSGITLETNEKYRRASENGSIERLHRARITFWRRHGLLPEIETMMLEDVHAYDFEIRGAFAYSKEKGIPVYCIEDNTAYDKLIKELQKYPQDSQDIRKRVSERNQYDRSRNQMRAETFYDDAQRFFSNADAKSRDDEHHVADIMCGNSAINIPRRDRVMAPGLLRIAERHPDAEIVHIGGLAHLLDDAKNRTLYSRIKNHASVRRATIRDYETA